MTLLPIAEVFGYPATDRSQAAQDSRARRFCPFRAGPCTKGNRADPLGICALGDEKNLAALCPIRFEEGQRVFRDVGLLAFGRQARIVAVPQVHILRVPPIDTDGQPSLKRPHKRVGKVDFLIAQLDDADRPVNFAALEVQAVYFSGGEIRSDFKQLLQSGKLPATALRRPDWRSSAQKRLMPQLALKLPVFRRWGKKFFVAIDQRFFESMPRMATTSSLGNSEITWLVYPFSRDGERERYTIGEPRAVYTLWEDVQTALREGMAPDQAEILDEIQRKRRRGRLPVIRVESSA